jgi:hypothetical protein
MEYISEICNFCCEASQSVSLKEEMKIPKRVKKEILFFSVLAVRV